MTNLGTLPGNACSAADAINSAGQIVGGSGFFDAPFQPACTDPVEHAVLWENGQILDLNNFVPPGTDLTLTEAFFINDRGDISGFGTLSNGDQHAFLLVPCEDKNDEDGGCGAPEQAITSATPASIPPQPLTPTVRNLPERFPSGPARSPRLPVSPPSAGFGEGIFQAACTRCCGQCPALTLTPSSLTFPAQKVGTKSAPETASLWNAGSRPASVPTISTVGPFSQTNNCPAVLRPHAICQIHVQFLPQAKGTAHGTLSVGIYPRTALSGLGE